MTKPNCPPGPTPVAAAGTGSASGTPHAARLFAVTRKVQYGEFSLYERIVMSSSAPFGSHNSVSKNVRRRRKPGA